MIVMKQLSVASKCVSVSSLLNSLTDAFKEAHGGGGLSGFVGLLTTALFILDGGPKPAFYDGKQQ
jgi:hypothetical protein